MISRLLKEPDNDSYAGRFAAKLRQLRLATGMSGEQMAEALREHCRYCCTRGRARVRFILANYSKSRYRVGCLLSEV